VQTRPRNTTIASRLPPRHYSSERLGADLGEDERTVGDKPDKQRAQHICVLKLDQAPERHGGEIWVFGRRNELT
jgi:hypothetical protein